MMIMIVMTPVMHMCVVLQRVCVKIAVCVTFAVIFSFVELACASFAQQVFLLVFWFSTVSPVKTGVAFNEGIVFVFACYNNHPHLVVGISKFCCITQN